MKDIKREMVNIMNNIIGLIVSIIFIGMIIGSAKIFEKSGKEASRKYIHIMLSNWWFIAMIFFDNWIWASILPAIFIVINYMSYKNGIIKVMERDKKDKNKDSLGTVYYAISLLILTITTFGILDNPFIGLCGILVMGYGDGLAAVLGKSIKSRVFKIRGNKKSIIGSFTMFVVTLLIVSSFLNYANSAYIILKSIGIAAIVTVIEMISRKGTDNLTVPLLTSLLVFVMM